MSTLEELSVARQAWYTRDPLLFTALPSQGSHICDERIYLGAWQVETVHR